MSGHHANIEKWRRDSLFIRTAKNRPDLLEKSRSDQQRMEFCAAAEESSGKEEESKDENI